jgi:hypothetical protein
MLKRFILGLVATTAVAAPLAVISTAPANAAGNPPCITRAEFRKIHNGMSLTQVRRIVGGTGRVSLSSPPIVIRDFKTCTAWHVSNVSFWSGRVDSKLYI